MPLAAFPKCFLDMLCVEHTMTPEQWVDMAAEQLDIDGLEFFTEFLDFEKPDTITALRKRVEDHGLTIPMLCYSPDFTKPDPEERQAEVERQKRAIKTAAILGAKYCRVLSGQRRPEVSREEGIGYAAGCIRACLPFAEEHGVTLILENHYKDSFWSFPEFAQKRDAFLALLEAVGESPNFGVNYDPSNAVVAGDDPIELLEMVKYRVKTMHASDRYFEGGATFEDLKQLDAHPMQGYASILKHGIIGRGMNDYDKIFSILAGVGFTGWVSIEDGQDPVVGMEHLRLSAEFLRAKMKQHGLR
jgi:sugar phosphate isomerase/epimerase